MSFRYELFESSPLKRVDTEEGRRYVTEDGNIYTSVTTALSYLTRKHIQRWRNAVGAEKANSISLQAARAGTKMHAIAEKYCLDEDWKKDANPVALNNFLNIKPYLDDNVETIYGVELQMYSNELKCAGTSDLLCDYQGINTILDFKTSRNFKSKEKITNYFLQAAAYGIMAEELYDWRPEQIVILMAVNNSEAVVYVEEMEHYRKLARNYFDLLHQGKIQEL